MTDLQQLVEMADILKSLGMGDTPEAKKINKYILMEVEFQIIDLGRQLRKGRAEHRKSRITT